MPLSFLSHRRRPRGGLQVPRHASVRPDFGVIIADCIVGGDGVWDRLAAGRKGALGVGLLVGRYSEDELERAGAFRVYADPGEILLHIEDLGIDRRFASEDCKTEDFCFLSAPTAVKTQASKLN